MFLQVTESLFMTIMGSTCLIDFELLKKFSMVLVFFMFLWIFMSLFITLILMFSDNNRKIYNRTIKLAVEQLSNKKVHPKELIFEKKK